jgi:hypothetical protein
MISINSTANGLLGVSLFNSDTLASIDDLYNKIMAAL